LNLVVLYHFTKPATGEVSLAPCNCPVCPTNKNENPIPPTLITTNTPVSPEETNAPTSVNKFDTNPPVNQPTNSPVQEIKSPTSNNNVIPKPKGKKPSEDEPFVRGIISYISSGTISFSRPGQGNQIKSIESTVTMKSLQLFLLINFHTSWKKMITFLPEKWRADFFVTIDVPIADANVRSLLYDKLGISN
jgi:hypothetical protein